MISGRSHSYVIASLLSKKGRARWIGAAALLVPAAAGKAAERAAAAAIAAAAPLAVQAILVLLRGVAEGVASLAAIAGAAAAAATKEQQDQDDDEDPEEDLAEQRALEGGRQGIALQRRALVGRESEGVQNGLGRERLAGRPDDLLRALA